MTYAVAVSGDGGTGGAPSEVRENRTERNRRLVHESLIRAALIEMAEHGVHNVTVRQIADRADVATATFYNYFADVREVEAAIIEMLNASVAMLEGHLKASDDVVDVTGLIFGRLIGFAVEHPHTASVFGQLLATGRAEAPKSPFIKETYGNVRSSDRVPPPDEIVPDMLALVMAGVVMQIAKTRRQPADTEIEFYISVMCSVLQFSDSDVERASKAAIQTVRTYSES